MKLLLLLLSLLACTFELTAMEYPLGVLVDEHTITTQTKMLTDVDTIEKSDELFKVSKQMFDQYARYKYCLQEASYLWPHVVSLTSMVLPTATAWQKETTTMLEPLRRFILGRQQMEQLFDKSLDTADGYQNHSATMALRQSLAKQFAERNIDYKSIKKGIVAQFSNQALAPCTRSASISAINAGVERQSDLDDKLLIYIKLVHFFTNFGDANNQFEHTARQVQRTFGIEPVKRKPTDSIDQVIIHCNRECVAHQKTVLKSYNKISSSVKEQVSTLNASAILKNSQLLLSSLNGGIEERKTLIKKLSKYSEYLMPHFLSSIQDTLSADHYAYAKISVVTRGAKPIVCPLAVTCAKVKVTHSIISNQSVTPCNLDKMREIKASYPHFVQFRLKEPLKHTNDKDSASIFYFCSKGSYITQKEAENTLIPTTAFSFETANQAITVQQSADTTNLSNTLWYHPNGQYYFMKPQDSQDSNIYKVDFVGALCFAKQQPTPAKI
jgi:hypothetical protein